MDSKRNAKELFRMMQLEFRVEDSIPIETLINSIKRIYFPFADENIAEGFEKDIELVFMNYANERNEIDEENFCKAMVR